MLLIDATYFRGDIDIPQLQAGNVGVGRIINSAGEKNVGLFIEKYQAEYLLTLLGHELYINFMEGLAEPVPLSIWVDMRERLTHSTTDKLSPIAYYVYCYLSNDGQTKLTIKGSKQDKSTYADNVSNGGKVVDAWYWMVKYSMDFYKWLDDNWDSYKDYSKNRPFHKFHNQFGLRNTLGI